LETAPVGPLCWELRNRAGRRTKGAEGRTGRLTFFRGLAECSRQGPLALALSPPATFAIFAFFRHAGNATRPTSVISSVGRPPATPSEPVVAHPTGQREADWNAVRKTPAQRPCPAKTPKRGGPRKWLSLGVWKNAISSNRASPYGCYTSTRPTSAWKKIGWEFDRFRVSNLLRSLAVHSLPQPYVKCSRRLSDRSHWASKTHRGPAGAHI